MDLTRRALGRLALGAAPFALGLSSELGLSRMMGAETDGVRLGVCTYSFRDLPHKSGDTVGTMIQACQECSASIIELFEPDNMMFQQIIQQVMKPGVDGKAPTGEEMGARYQAFMQGPEAGKLREQLRQQRITTPMEHFHQMRKRFDKAGIDIYAFTQNFGADYTDEELEKCFQQVKALGVKIIAASTQVSMLPRLKPLAEKHRIYVAVHGHSNTKDQNEFSSPESFQKALDASDWFKVNLDIGHFSAAGFDPVTYITEQHTRISHLHIKDRKKNDGPNEEFGQGDTPIKPVLLLLKERRYAIPALIEYEYPGAGTPIEEVKKCLAYMRAVVAA